MSDDTNADLALRLEEVTEALADAHRLLDADNLGWATTGVGGSLPGLDLDALRAAARVARVMAVADALLSRGINLRVAYVWGQGVTVAARQGGEDVQDVNAVVQDFLTANAATFTSGQAREAFERSLATDGNRFIALPTDPHTGAVRVRTIPWDEIGDILTNPEDTADPWFYRRTYTTSVVEDGYAGGLRTRRETRTVYYPALGHRPGARPDTIDGKPIEWDTPVLHVTVNRPEQSPWGVGDTFAAIPWSKAYRAFLVDWAALVRALSKFAFRATAKTKAGAARTRTSLAAAGEPGQVAITGEDQKFEAIGKSGATIDSQSGRPLAAMVASALDIPVTMLLADPGVTGARATAETLDFPMELIFGMRRDLHADVIRAVLGHVIDAAVRAPAGKLTGTVTTTAGREVVELAGGQDRTIDVDWPDLSQESMTSLVDAVVKADGTGTLPPAQTLRLLLIALGVEDADSIVEDLTDDDGRFLWPADTNSATAQQDAVAAGNLPAPLG